MCPPTSIRRGVRQGVRDRAQGHHAGHYRYRPGYRAAAHPRDDDEPRSIGIPRAPACFWRVGRRSEYVGRAMMMTLQS